MNCLSDVKPLYTFSIRIDDIPRPQPRHRHTQWGTYDPARDRKNLIRYMTNNQIPRSAPFEGPISVCFTFGMPIPASTNKSEREHLLKHPTPHVRPGDIDNIQKTYLDTFNEILYKDDRQIFHVEAQKLYMEKPVVILDFKVYDPKVLTVREQLVLDEETEQYEFL